MSGKFFDLPRRTELMNTLYGRRDSIRDHEVRIDFEIKNGDEASLAGALTDYYINTDKDDYLKRLDQLKKTMNQLSTDWILLFYDYLQEEFNETTPLPYNQWSIFTEDVQGHFDYIENPFK